MHLKDTIHDWQLTLLWTCNEFLDLKVFPHWLHWTEIPSKWLASMCFFRLQPLASFPHSVHWYNVSPVAFFLKVFTINVLILLSSSSRSSEKFLVSATVPKFVSCSAASFWSSICALGVSVEVLGGRRVYFFLYSVKRNIWLLEKVGS